jgi:DNA (cytosine-5)-methyltransferase 1
MFSGYGGAEFAFEKANIYIRCVGISEINKFAIQIYNQNFPNIKNFGDCVKINPMEIPEFDFLTGGFPCQDVSLTGNRDLNNGRTNLYQEILRIVSVKKPKYLLLENVKGLLSMDLSNEKMENRLIDKIVRDLKNLNYGVCWKVLNSKDYGIPQNRERVWFVCKYDGWDFMEFKFPEKERLIIKLKDLLEDEIDKKYYLSDNQIEKIRSRERWGDHLFEQIPEYSPTLMAIGKDDVSIIQSKYNEVRKFLISPTITSTESNTTYVVLNETYRRLTPRECFRLQGFVNDEINISGISDNQLYRLVGNGWDINLVSKILKNINIKDK